MDRLTREKKSLERNLLGKSVNGRLLKEHIKLIIKRQPTYQTFTKEGKRNETTNRGTDKSSKNQITSVYTDKNKINGHENFRVGILDGSDYRISQRGYRRRSSKYQTTEYKFIIHENSYKNIPLSIPRSK